MRIGIDARLVFYNRAGIGQYIIQLTEALSSLEPEDDKFILLQSRKDKSPIINSNGFELFGTHDCALASSTGLPTKIMGDTGK